MNPNAFTSLPPYLGDVSAPSEPTQGVIGDPSLTQEELEHYASGQHFVRQIPQQQIQFIPLPQGLNSQHQQQFSQRPALFNLPLLLQSQVRLKILKQ